MDVSESVVAVLLELTPAPNLDYLATLSLARVSIPGLAMSVPPGGATVVEFKLQVPGNYMLVDHALTRVERGLVGILQVDGPQNPDIFNDQDPAKSAKSLSH